MADVKSLLKDARKLIDDKNYKDAQECCKNILRKDKQNYLALVLLGKSLQDSDQAPLAYQKAIANKPEHPLAWQGLATYYEVKEETKKLLSVYMEILLLHIEEEKALEVITKIGHIGCTLRSSDAIHSLIQYVGKSPDKKVMGAAEKQLLELLKAEVPCSQGDIQLILTWLLNLYERDPTDSLEILYGKMMLQRDDHLSVVEDIINSKFFCGNVVLRELVCKFLCKKFVEMNSFDNFPIEKYIDSITEGIENSKYPGLLRSMICYNKGLYLEAYKQCVPLVNYHQADVTESVFIINCSINLKKWTITQKLASNFLIKAKDQVYINKLKKFLFLSLSKLQKWKQAIAAIKDLDIDTLTTNELVNLAECYIEIDKPAGQVLEKLKSTEHYKQLQALLLLKEGKYEEIIKLLIDQADNALNCFYLGRANLELQQHDKGMVNLLKAAKMNPEHPYTFLYLGHFYKNHKSDFEKAKRCYEKAYSLNNIDNEIARSLSEIYSIMGMKEADFELLYELEKNIQIKDSWISFKLGLHYLNRREWDNSITHFRNVIKINKNNLVAFECLADAYYCRGSYTSALRAYDKVMTMDPTRSPHCLTRIGYIYSLLTQYEESISTFEKVINIVPQSLLALKGIGETWMKIAKKKVGAKIFGTARVCAQNAVNYTMKALVEYPQYFSIWKLLADTLMFITKLPNKYAYVHMKNLIKDKADNEILRREKLDIFPQAIACYSHIAKQKQQSTSYNLAAAYLDFYCETRSPINYQISFKLVVACIKEKPTLWRNWNLLGKLCLYLKKYDVAQHCFIKALLVTRKWSVAKIWCNLGTLYLKLNLYKLANYCFWRGQSTLPSYPHSWIGQGLIAEVIREEEAMDLFRHASRLGYHPESALGYADWVCRMLKTGNYKADMELKYVIDGLYAIPYAIDLVEWYHCFEPENACACTILGILQETSGLLRSAYKSYEKALRFAQEEHKNIALLNIGRILIRMEKYDEAIKVHKSVTEASLNSTCGLALALYKKGLYEESYSAYDTALHWLSNSDDEKADLLVAMAGIVYMFKGADEAKTLLFHSIQISQNKPTAYSLFAICSLGLIHSDQNLSKLALSELKKYERDYNYGFDIGFLKSYIHVAEKEMNRAIKILSDSLHDHPNNAMLWFCMAQYCLKTSSAKRRTASCCAQKALCSVYNCDIDDHNPGKILATASIAEHISGNSSKAILLAKKGLHLYPNEGVIWAALLFSLSSNKEWMKRKKWLVSAAEYMRNHLTISRPLRKWVSYIEKHILL